ncbi:hypothetical protein MHC_02290 [Mycoplasma haemocanis str. Illinois]|uniref:Uncharacterized protein n=1 Tax=Mycoplasma haemocanis (strain Illinois) TaxID=1111676 RepID=H6N6Q2_MYCHN|nr:hypothetical protein [Mycoplasma haemocanis]AEW45324.1 hypothetical protein MHC_02290 [Mycoplasma haemocanis str. Illinois]
MVNKFLLLGGSSAAAVSVGVGLNALGSSSPLKQVTKALHKPSSCTVFLVESEGNRKASIMGDLETLKRDGKIEEDLWNTLQKVCEKSPDRRVYVGNIGNPKKLTHEERYQQITWTFVDKTVN